MKLHRYRVVRPLRLYGRVLSTHEIVRLPEDEGLVLVESGHLREIDLTIEVNGSDPVRWVEPMTR